MIHILCTLNDFFVQIPSPEGGGPEFLEGGKKKVATNILPKNTVDGRNPAPVDR